MRRLALFAILLGAISAALGAWIAIVLVPEARETVHAQASSLERLRAQTNTLVTAGLSTAMFERDYGRAQELLSNYQDANYLTRAAVTNNDMVVVAIIGTLPEVRIGANLPPELAPSVRRLPLRMRSETVGELIYLAGAIEIDPAIPQARMETLTVASQGLAIVALLSLFAFCVCLLRWRDDPR